jgi:hypothetical protein
MAEGLRFTKDDFDGDTRSYTWETKPVSAYADYDTYLAALTALDAAISDWSNGRDHAAQAVQDLYDIGNGASSVPAAQAGLRVIIEGKDIVTGVVYKFPFMMPDLAKAAEGGQNAWTKTGQGSQTLTVMNSAHPDYISFKALFEANVVSPSGNLCTMERGYVEE